MDAQHLLSASFIDIVFEGRNKEYGAYALRKNYNKTLSIAMTVTAIIIGVFLIFYFIDRSSHHKIQNVVPDKVILSLFNPEPAPKPVEVTPPPRIPASSTFNSIKVTSPPIIIKDKDVLKEDVPPEISDIDKMKIGLVNEIGGNNDDGLVPPVGSVNGVIGNIAGDKKDAEPEFIPVEVESAYPGGNDAWRRFLIKTLKYPQSAQDNFIQGAVIVRFIVDIHGSVSNVEVISGPQELRSEAIRVMAKSGKWVPAMQNGRYVKSYKQQSIVFRLENE